MLRLLVILALAGAVVAQSASNKTIVGKLPTVKNLTATNGKPASSDAGHDMDAHAGHSMPGMAAAGGAAAEDEKHSMDDGHDHGSSSSSSSKSMAPTKALPVPDACVKTPTAANCSAFTYPEKNAANDLARLCGAMSFMTACSVSKACSAAGIDKKVSSSNADVCNTFNHVATVCKLDTGMGRMGGCENFRSMCVTDSPCKTQCPAQCKLAGLTAIPTTAAVNTQVRAICDAKPTMAGCAECAPSWAAGKKWGDCDLLTVYSELCGADPSMAQCVEFHNMCGADSSLSFCSKYNDAAKKVADSVLKNKGADPDSQQAGKAGSAAKSGAAAASGASLLLLALAAGAAAVLSF